MKAIQINKYGGNEVIENNNNAEIPTVGPAQVLVEIYASGINPIDYKVREGYTQAWKPLPFPITLGSDVAGIVREVGPEVKHLNVGDEVFGSASQLDGNTGALAEFAVTCVDLLAKKPTKISMEEASAIPVASTSAYDVLVGKMHLLSGQKILIHGGAGGIGSMAIQIAKHLGAFVVTTAAASDFDYVKELGADLVIDYKNEKFEEMATELDAVFDTVGGETYVRSFQTLKEGGIIVSMIEQPNTEFMAKYGVTAIAQQTRVSTEGLEKISDLIDKNIISIYIDRIFPLEEAVNALEYLRTQHPRGKVVVKIKNSLT